MKRELFDNVMVIPGASGAVIDRHGFLSAVFAADVGSFTGDPTGASLSIKVEHCDTANGSFAAVPDKKLDPEHASEGGVLPAVAVAADETVQFNLDLLGCKRYIKITPTITFEGGTSPAAGSAAYALVLGDAAEAPV